jgi:hypothetical protein
METITIGPSRGQWIVTLTGSLCFVAAGFLILAIGESPLTGWSGIIFFGACALVSAWQLFDARPRIVIDDRGILDRTLNVGVIEWSDILDATVKRTHDNPFICLDLRDPAKYVGRLSPMMRRMVDLNRRLGFTELSLNLTGTNMDPERLRELILKEVTVRSGAQAA